MTRKEIEKRCLEEMQRSIPDSEALWQRIEQQLPPQEEASQPTANIKMTHTRRILSIAASLALIIAGAAVFTQQERMNSAPSNNMSEDHIQMEQPAEEKYEAEQFPIQSESDETHIADSTKQLRSYASLNIPHTDFPVSLSAAGTQGEYFSERDVLEKAQCFVYARVDRLSEGSAHGEIRYDLEIQNVYGSQEPEGSISVSSITAYQLEENHLYLLPLYYENEQWHLTYECAPQIEMTLDREAVHHNGWHSIMNSLSEPLLYEQHGADDYFYDRMYLTDWAVINAFLAEWEASKNV